MKEDKILDLVKTILPSLMKENLFKYEEGIEWITTTAIDIATDIVNKLETIQKQEDVPIPF